MTLALVPIVAIVLLFAYGVLALLAGGYRSSSADLAPNYSNPVLQVAVGMAIFASFPCALAVAIGLPATRRLRLSSADFLTVLTALVGLILLVAALGGTPGDWFAG